MIQRWYKQILEERLLKEADSALKQTKALIKMQKQKLINKHVIGRESVTVDDPYTLWGGNNNLQNDLKTGIKMESFSLFGGN